MATTRRARRWDLLPYALALPILAYEGFLLLYPIGRGVLASFTRTEIGGGAGTWVGLANYRRLLDDPGFWRVLRTTLLYMGGLITVAIVAGLVTALVLNRAFRGRTAARAAMTLPWAFPDVPTVLVFTWMLNPTFGVMNLFARLLPGVDDNPKWLLDPSLAMLSVVLITAWKAFPFYGLVLLAALQTVPGELYEAARVDGAGALRVFRSVTLPGILPTLLLLVVLACIFSFRQFTIVFLLTGGGPSGATETLVVRVYNTAFRFYDFSYGAAIASVGFLVTLAIAFVFLGVQRRQDAEVA